MIQNEVEVGERIAHINFVKCHDIWIALLRDNIVSEEGVMNVEEKITRNVELEKSVYMHMKPELVKEL